jgi:hypothetical protein
MSLPVLLIAALLLLGGCGDSGEGETSQTATQTQGATTSQGKAQGTTTSEDPDASLPEGTEDLSPKAAAYYAERLKESFPKPKPAPGARQISAKAIQAGQQACKGATPTEIAERYEEEAKLDPDQDELLEELPRYEEEAVRDPSFVAGQIAAMVYEATLAGGAGDYGFQGCVFALAGGLERQLAAAGSSR